ncbi:DegT/DnrJ/EryC1/StrS family aminotransferase [Parachitinimonas caeni]|uniref:DegT/DnrJ/EryC1/StrS family aminotransferase n=1 Tax=Parachitinimonas caeni TaxID=3031301 RepID=A0ABT7DS32_9NEIS|nr:DegT/DnrJ/EryC1/StrS family aminotransferase [Parachitinimonas caeni]MDK2122883.1 DegT/DnrJ/EryC1/StrS family aminotransferase [Parachitinimonas caeni]
MTIEFIDLKAQYRHLKSHIDQRIHAVLEHGQYIMGPEVAELEGRLAGYLGVKHAIGVSDGTTALLIALMALDIKAGDEVITTPFSFIATTEVIALLGAVPVFVDIDPKTYNLDPALLEAAISPRTRAIMPVSLYGQCADYDAINAIAEKHGLPVIEDAAQSFGARYKQRASCNLTTIACTSFFPSKPLGCYGDGGACFTNNDALANRMRQIRIHGQDRRYHHPVLGLNGRLDTIQAAVLLAKLDTFDEELAARDRIAARYADLLGDLAPYVETWNRSVYAQYTVEVANRAEVQAALKAAGVPTAVHYPVPLHRQPVLAGLALPAGSFPLAEAAAERVMSLPMSPFLNEVDQHHVATSLLRALQR